ncbi:ciliary microtubule inner protein 5 [Neosynchiropus ocellatus]
MELNHIQRVSSAGYRLPERIAKTSRTPEATARIDNSEPPRALDPVDQVTRDRVWREMIWSERKTEQEWEKNWGFLRNYDHLGQPKSEERLPSSVPLFSDRVPNTSNQMFGCRLSTPLGSELIRLDRLLLRFGRQHERDPETQS